MSVTATTRATIPNEVTAVVGQVESGVGMMYMGTDQGDIWKFNQATYAYALVKNVGGKILSMMLYSGILYVTVAGGKIFTVTTY